MDRQRLAGTANESRSAARGRLDHGGKRRSFNPQKSAASERAEGLPRLSPLQRRSDRVEQSDRLRQSEARCAARSRGEVSDPERRRAVPGEPSRALRQSQDRGGCVRQHDCALAETGSFFWVFRLSCEAQLGDCTAEARRARSKECLIMKFSELCELCIAMHINSRGLRKFIVQGIRGRPAGRPYLGLSAQCPHLNFPNL